LKEQWKLNIRQAVSFLALHLYSCSIFLVIWIILAPWQLLQILIGRSVWPDLLERLGRNCCPEKSGSSRLMIHAVSVGEMVGASAVIASLSEKKPDIEVFLTAGNCDGRAMARQLEERFPSVKSVVYLPWDSASILQRWFKKWDPDMLVVMETEIWPNLFNVCNRQSIPLFIVSGRIYPNDFRAYRLMKWFFKPVLDCVEWFGVQSEQEKIRFVQIGADPRKTEVKGSLKLNSQEFVLGSRSHLWFETLKSSGLLLIAGSTHSPEESWLFDIYLSLRLKHPALRLAIAPRHIRRTSEVKQLAERRNLRVVKWTQLPKHPDQWDVLLVDRLGRLGSLYAYGEVAFIGGSLIPRGGHNLMEAAIHGCAIVIGPHFGNFQEAVERLYSENAIFKLNHRQDLFSVLNELCTDRSLRQKTGTKAQSLVQSLQNMENSTESYTRVILKKLTQLNKR